MDEKLSAEWVRQGNLYALEGAICDTDFMQNEEVNMEIRYITKSDDWHAVSKVYEESWKYAYQGIVPQDYLDGILEGHWVSHIKQENRKNLVLVLDGQVITVCNKILHLLL